MPRWSIFTEERRKDTIKRAKNKDLCPIFEDFCPRKWRKRVAAYTPLLRNAL